MNPDTDASTPTAQTSDDGSSAFTSPVDSPVSSSTSSATTPPSLSALHSPSSPTPHITPTSIRDFRATTSLLSILHKARHSFHNVNAEFFEVSALSPNHCETSTNGSDLKPLSALANLLVRNKEVVAVACKQMPGGTTQSDEAPAPRNSEIYTWIATTNTPNPKLARRASDPTPGQSKHIIKPATSDVQLQSLDEVAQYAVDKGSSPSLEEHGGLLLHMVQHADPSLLSAYILAVSHPKISHRLGRTNSRQWISALELVNDQVILEKDVGPFRENAKDEIFINSFSKLVIAERSEAICLFQEPRKWELWKHSALQLAARGLDNVCSSSDFHRVLCGLIGGFQSALRGFTTLLGRLSSLEDPSPPVSKVRDGLERLNLWWQTLHDMVQSDAMSSHFTTIGGHLDDAMVREVVADEEETDEDDVGDTDGDDADLVGKRASHSCHRFLLLVVAHLTSASILKQHYVKDPKIKPTLKIITLADPGCAMSTWKQLLQRQIARESSPNAPSSGDPSADIFPTERLLESLSRLTQTPTTALLQWFPENFGEGGVLSRGDNFSGSVHCEAMLMSLVYLTAKAPAELDDDIKAEFIGTTSLSIGVSKRSCPICAELLVQFATDLDIRLAQPASHSTVCVCDMPPGLPSAFQERLAGVLWRKLESKLMALERALSSTKAEKERRLSTGSNQSEAPSDTGNDKVDPDELFHNQAAVQKIYHEGW